MSKVLLNNVGNRHLRFTKEGQEWLYNEKKEFRKRTKEFFEKKEQNDHSGLTLEILPPALEEHKPDLLVLFATDQSETNPAHSSQDTLWAARLIEQAVNKKYKIETHLSKTF
ncbi:MAG: hypothetical protein Kow00127_24390 [Bacteroidales bacterium]